MIHQSHVCYLTNKSVGIMQIEKNIMNEIPEIREEVRWR